MSLSHAQSQTSITFQTIFNQLLEDVKAINKITGQVLTNPHKIVLVIKSLFNFRVELSQNNKGSDRLINI